MKAPSDDRCAVADDEIIGIRMWFVHELQGTLHLRSYLVDYTWTPGMNRTTADWSITHEQWIDEDSGSIGFSACDSLEQLLDTVAIDDIGEGLVGLVAMSGEAPPDEQPWPRSTQARVLALLDELPCSTCVGDDNLWTSGAPLALVGHNLASACPEHLPTELRRLERCGPESLTWWGDRSPLEELSRTYDVPLIDRKTLDALLKVGAPA